MPRDSERMEDGSLATRLGDNITREFEQGTEDKRMRLVFVTFCTISSFRC